MRFSNANMAFSEGGLPFTTISAEAQLRFDRGMVWCYGFNHEEAIVCFEHALRADPQCAMAHWGIAYAVGPNYNKRWEVFDEAYKHNSLGRALDECAKAMEVAVGATEIERKLIHALAMRYPPTIRNPTSRPGQRHMQPPCAKSSWSMPTIWTSGRSTPKP